MHRPEEQEAFDRAFMELFDQSNDVEATPDEVVVQAYVDGPIESGSTFGEATTAPVTAYSRHEYLKDRDISSCSAEELELINSVLTYVARRHSRAFRRRTRRGATVSRTPDIRRSIDRARSTQGEMIELFYRMRRPSRRRVVFLVDISGSMEAYVPAFLRLIHGISRADLHVEMFSLGTRLTRLSRALSTAFVDEALSEVRRSVRDWSGGTRLGESLGYFNDVFGIRGLARGAMVVVVSDGLDRGDPAILARQMQRLHLVARQVIWVNPLKAGDRYKPLARGMSAALPNIDHFISGHSLSSLIDLVDLIYGATPLSLAPSL